MSSLKLVVPLAILLSLIACSAPAAPPPATAAPSAASGPAPTAAPAAPAKPAAAAKIETVNFGMVTPSPSYWPVIAAQAKGFFQNNGINLETVLTDSSARLTQAMIGGSIQMGMVATDAGVIAIESGADIVIIGGVVNVPTYSLVSNPSLKRIADLKGKKLGATALQTGDAVLLRKLLSANGLKDNEYTVIVAGALAQRYAAMINGAIDAATLTEPQESMLVDQGFNLLGRTGDAVKDYQFLVHVVKKDWGKANEGLVVRYLKAVKEATAWVYDPKNKDEAIKVLMDATKADAKYTAKTYDTYQQLQGWPRDVGVGEAGMKTLMEITAEQGQLKLPLAPASKYMDLSYLKQLGTP